MLRSYRTKERTIERESSQRDRPRKRERERNERKGGEKREHGCTTTSLRTAAHLTKAILSFQYHRDLFYDLRIFFTRVEFVERIREGYTLPTFKTCNLFLWRAARTARWHFFCRLRKCLFPTSSGWMSHYCATMSLRLFLLCDDRAKVAHPFRSVDDDFAHSHQPQNRQKTKARTDVLTEDSTRMRFGIRSATLTD